jgi:hypothetical protein
VAVVEHKHVELLHVGHQPVDPVPAERQQLPLAPVRAHRVDEADVVEHQRSDLERVLAQIRQIDGAVGEEAAEGDQRRETVPDGSPAEQSRLQPNPQMPLQATTQPGLADPVEVHGLGRARLVLAARDSRIELQIPDLALPPLARVVGEAQEP